MHYATIQYTKDVGSGWDCASPRCKNPATICIRRTDYNRQIPARAMVYCERHATIIQRNLAVQLFPAGQRVVQYFGSNPSLTMTPSAIIPSDYGQIVRHDATGPYPLGIRFDGLAEIEKQQIPTNAGLWAVYE